jgi:hypothetical protein
VISTNPITPVVRAVFAGEGKELLETLPSAQESAGVLSILPKAATVGRSSGWRKR